MFNYNNVGNPITMELVKTMWTLLWLSKNVAIQSVSRGEMLIADHAVNSVSWNSV